MKTRNIFSALLGFSLMFSACNSEDVDYAAPSAKTPGVHLRLTGAATGNTTSRATVEAEEGEKTVNSLVAVLFDTHEGFYKTVSATCINEATNEYTFIVEKDATYDIWLVANASDKLKGELENIPEGTKMEDENGLNYLESITADQAPDAEGNFLMVSKYSEKVTTHITESQSIGEVHMIRLAARFDLLNKAEGVTVTNIEFANRTVKSAVLTPNTMNNASHWFEKKDYSLNVTGDPENGTAWNGQIYTYENHSEAESEQTPTLTITYYEGDDATETKTHEVKLIDPNSTTGKTMPIKRNNLYRIILTKATKLDFDLQVLDWDDEEAEIEHPEVPLILPKDVQDSLNRQLLVYDLFTEYNVKSIDFDNNTVEFYDSYDNYENGSSFSFDDLNKGGLMGEGAVLQDKNGNKYRVPTFGDIQLLVTVNGYINTVGNPKYGARTIAFVENYSKIYYYDENVYLKNNVNNEVDSSHDISTENSYGFHGQSCQISGRDTNIYGLTSDNRYTDIPELMSVKYTQRPIYGVRFQGTNQYAAYKWEHIYLDGDKNKRAISVKIKALPKDLELEEVMKVIVNNRSYWRDDECINFIILLSGGSNEREKSLMSSTRTFRMLAGADGISIYNFSTTSRIGLRLVKVKKEENESAE